jgi:hypothetical protein
MNDFEAIVSISFELQTRFSQTLEHWLFCIFKISAKLKFWLLTEDHGPCLHRHLCEWHSGGVEFKLC